MNNMEFFQRARFYFDLRGSEQHPQLVEMVKKSIGESVKNPEIIDRIFMLIRGDNANPDYSEALKMYEAYYAGMSNEQLLEYAGYLHETFGFRIPKVRVSLTLSSQHQQQR